MLLSELIDKYERSNDLKPSSVQQLRWNVRSFSRHLGRDAEVSDLNADAINQHLLAMRNEGRQPSTMRTQRVNLVTLWKFARRQHYVLGKPGGGVRRIKVPRVAPRAWGQEEVLHLLRVASSMRGTVPPGHKAAIYWRAYLLTGWDTGLRRCDLVRVKASDVRGGILTLTQEKTGDSICCHLRPETVAALEALGEQGLAWTAWEAGFYRHFRRLLKLANLTGKPRWLRRSSATAVEIEHPGMGGRHLGHKTPGLAERHYIDPTLLARNKPQPPSLG